jgi:hypothetical protein
MQEDASFITRTQGRKNRFRIENPHAKGGTPEQEKKTT